MKKGSGSILFDAVTKNGNIRVTALTKKLASLKTPLAQLN